MASLQVRDYFFFASREYEFVSYNYHFAMSRVLYVHLPMAGRGIFEKAGSLLTVQLSWFCSSLPAGRIPAYTIIKRICIEDTVSGNQI